jgi:hypothetical protein
MKKPEPVFVRELSREKMIDGNEKFFTKVIDNGMIKDWVGIGWVADVPAKEEDYCKYPEVQR